MKNPCYDSVTKTGCPARRPGCSVDCVEWAEYVEERDRIYKVRQQHHDLNRACGDIGRARRSSRDRKKLRDRSGKGKHH